jgi:hypothetical protein
MKMAMIPLISAILLGYGHSTDARGRLIGANDASLGVASLTKQLSFEPNILYSSTIIPAEVNHAAAQRRLSSRSTSNFYKDMFSNDTIAHGIDSMDTVAPHYTKRKVDLKVLTLEATIKAVKAEVTTGNFEQVGKLKQLAMTLIDAKKEQKMSMELVSTLRQYIKHIRKSVAQGDFSKASELPKLSHELGIAQDASAAEERPQTNAEVFSTEADKRTLVVLKLMLQVKKLRDDLASKNKVVKQKQLEARLLSGFQV